MKDLFLLAVAIPLNIVVWYIIIYATWFFLTPNGEVDK